MFDALDPVLRAVGTATGEMRVSTTTLLPSGAIAAVRVRPQGDGCYLVSDDRSGHDDVLAAGLQPSGHDTRRGVQIADRLGLDFDGAAFSLRQVGADQLASAIVFVAEAAREWSAGILARAARREEANLRSQVERRLEAIFAASTIGREAELAGFSQKTHRFDFVVALPHDRKAVFELVLPHPNALAAAHLKLFDLKAAHPQWPREAVTERLEAWSGADMNLLNGVSSHVRDMRHEWRDLEGLLH